VMLWFVVFGLLGVSSYCSPSVGKRGVRDENISTAFSISHSFALCFIKF